MRAIRPPRGRLTSPAKGGILPGRGPPLSRLRARLSRMVRVLNSGGSRVGELRYKPYGETRTSASSTPTDYRYTGQRQEESLGLYQMGARWYDPALARWLSTDTVVPEAGNPQALNRYSYVLGNPLRYTDPTGHIPIWVLALGVVGLIGGGVGIGVGYDILTTPAITDHRATPPPISGDTTPWLLDQIKTNAQADVTSLMRGAWQSNDPIQKAGALKAWIAQVRATGRWDFKYDFALAGVTSREHVVQLGGRLINYQAVANIHFGFMGRAVGFSSEILHSGAGLFHLYDNRDNPSVWGTWETRFDQPFDYWWIDFGIFLYEQFGDGIADLTPEAFEQWLQKYIEEHGEPPPESE